MEIREQVELAEYTTFGVGGKARYFAHAKTEADIPEAVAWAKEHGTPLFVLGGGSNLLVPDEGYDGLVLHVDLRGFDSDKVWTPDLIVAAGEPWDQVVDVAIKAKLAGIECLAGIPGSAGGTPVQNVGAYGQDVSQTIFQVRVFDRESMTFRWMRNAECGFRYRESVFNTTARGRYIVTSVHFVLRYGKPELNYAELQKRFEGGWKKPELMEVAEAVRDIRRGKGMLIDPGDPDSRSAGSFFKNPIVPVNVAEGILGVPQWPAGEGTVKLPAAWLLEHAGFVKGYGSGPVKISSKHTLALTNRGGARFADVVAMQDEIVAGVYAKFGVRLEREPVVLG